jgi:hypothetical protein
MDCRGNDLVAHQSERKPLQLRLTTQARSVDPA